MTIPIAIELRQHFFTDKTLAGTHDLDKQFVEALPAHFRIHFEVTCAEDVAVREPLEHGLIRHLEDQVLASKDADWNGRLHEKGVNVLVLFVNVTPKASELEMGSNTGDELTR